MFDNLREESSSSPLFTEPQQEEKPVKRFNFKPSMPPSNFLGMTAAQRMVIALLLFMMVCVLGSFCLLATDRFYLPF